MKTKTDEILSQLDEIKNGMRRNWAFIGHLLSLVEDSGLWRSDASSFTSWMSAHSSDFGVKPTVLWAHLRMVRYYRTTMLKDLRRWHIDAPADVIDLSKDVKCDLMEIYAKIANVAPDDVVRSLAARLMEGTVKRSELRSIWHVYRNQGMLAPNRRGRISTEKISAVKQRAENNFEANLLAALAVDKMWSDKSQDTQLSAYHVRQQVTVLEEGRKQKECKFDIVVLVKWGNGDLKIHGIDIQRTKMPDYEQLLRKRKYVDSLWLALPDEFDEQFSDRIPRHVGRIRVDGTGVIATTVEPTEQADNNSLLVTARKLLER